MHYGISSSKQLIISLVQNCALYNCTLNIKYSVAASDLVWKNKLLVTGNWCLVRRGIYDVAVYVSCVHLQCSNVLPGSTAIFKCHLLIAFIHFSQLENEYRNTIKAQPGPEVSVQFVDVFTHM